MHGKKHGLGRKQFHDNIEIILIPITMKKKINK